MVLIVVGLCVGLRYRRLREVMGFRVYRNEFLNVRSFREKGKSLLCTYSLVAYAQNRHIRQGVVVTNGPVGPQGQARRPSYGHIHCREQKAPPTDTAPP